MGIVTNEYVHEDFVREEQNGDLWIFYEPVDYVPMIGVSATIYVKGREECAFYGSDGWLLPDGGRFSGACVMSGSFNPSTGVIKLLWDKHPGEHFLCVSYDFDEGPIEDEEELFAESAPRLNWIQEGF